MADLTAIRTRIRCVSPPVTVALTPGTRYGRGVVLEEIRVPHAKRRNGVRGARLRCNCGTIYTAPATDLAHGRTTSCGCRHLEAFQEQRARLAAAADPAARRQSMQQYREDHRKEIRDQQRQYYLDNRDARLSQRRQYHADLRAAVFGHYGTACSCCGSSKRLVLDHVNSDGPAHRTAIFGKPKIQATMFYRWVIDNGFPEGLQVLCHSCNASKAAGPYCRMHQDGGARKSQI